MLAAVLAEDDMFARIILYRSRIHKFSVVRYRDPVKLADNLPELRPDVVVVREQDFPLHWEILSAEVTYLQSLQGSAQGVRFVLFTVPGSAPKEPARPRTEIFITDTLSEDSVRRTQSARDDPVRIYSSLLSAISRGTPPAVPSEETPPNSLISLAQKRVKTR